MSGHSVEEIRKETRVYILVFVALAALTLVTVGVSYLHLSFGAAVALALIDERKMVYAVLILTVIRFVALLLLPLGGYADRLR